MSDMLEKLQRELEATRQALAEAKAHCVRQEAEHNAVMQELEGARKKIEHSHQEWMAALDVLEDPVFLHDKEYRILRCNRAYQRCAGMPFKQIIGRPYYEIFPKTDAPLPHCSQTGSAEGSEDEVIAGTAIYRSRSFSIKDEKGNYHSSMLTLEDITSRRLMENRLQESKDLLHSIVEHAPLRVFWKDRDFRYLGCNSLLAKDAGYSSPEELIGKTDFDMAWKEQAELYRADDSTVMESGEAKLDYEELQTRTDGRMLWLSTSKVPLRDAGNRIIGLLGIYQDITQRKMAEKLLQESEERLSAIFEGALDGIVLADPETKRLALANPAMCRMLGYSKEELEQLGVADIHPAEDVPHVVELFEKQMRGEIQIAENLPVMRKNGSVFYADINSTPITFHDRKYLLGVFRDITERKQHEADIQRVNRALTLLSQCNTVLIHATNEREILTEICKLAVETGGYLMAWAGFAEHDADKTVHPVAQSGYEEGYLDHAKISWADNERGHGPTGTAIRERRTVVNQNIHVNSAMQPWIDAALKRGYQSSIALPLADREQTFGALTIYAAESNAFTEEEVVLLEEMANDLAYGIATLRTRKEHEQHAVVLRRSLEQSIQTIADTVEARDPYTAGHQRRVADLATAIAREMGLPEEQINGLHLAAIVHDVGKIHIPAEILSKPGRLSPIELSLVKTHAQAGYDILKNVKFPWPIADIILQHHERQDGSGYPNGLQGEQILPEARILAVADVVESMISHRPYRPGLGEGSAFNEIRKNRGKLYDPEVVDACLRLCTEKGYQLPAS